MRVSVESSHTKVRKPIEFFYEEMEPVFLEKVMFGLQDR